MQAWPSTFSSSRTLPGQLCRGQHDMCALGEAANLLAKLPGEAFHEKADQKRQIFLTIGQSRDVNFNHRKPVVEIFAKQLVGYGGAQVAVSGGDDVDVDAAGVSEPTRRTSWFCSVRRSLA
jgi:hypothetical protein